MKTFTCISTTLFNHKCKYIGFISGKKLLDEAIEGKTNEEPMTEATLFGAIDAFQEAMQIVGESHVSMIFNL